MSVLALYNNLNTFLVIGALLFGIGIYGIVTRRTLIGMLIAAELILAGSSVNFMAFNRFTSPDPVTGQAGWYDVRVCIYPAAANEPHETSPQFNKISRVPGQYISKSRGKWLKYFAGKMKKGAGS